jgi:hypothetical protein
LRAIWRPAFKGASVGQIRDLFKPDACTNFFAAAGFGFT